MSPHQTMHDDIDCKAYRKLLQRLEDLEDLQAMREAEAEYWAGEGCPFSEIVAEMEAEERVDLNRDEECGPIWRCLA